MSELETILAERKQRYGDFAEQAYLSQRLKIFIRCHIAEKTEKLIDSNGRDWPEFSTSITEAIDMICHKLARIVNGDPTYRDHWLDIAGYATLVADILKERNNAD